MDPPPRDECFSIFGTIEQQHYVIVERMLEPPFILTDGGRKTKTTAGIVPSAVWRSAFVPLADP
jgi:hypothetical protein